MADGTKIEWTDATWNPITGCSVVSAGCKHCYAMKLAGTRMKHTDSRKGLTIDTKAGPVWNGEVRFNEEWLDQPLAWTKARMIFVNAHGDTFHEGVPWDWVDKIMARAALAPQHVFQVLTKRSARMREYMNDPATPARIHAELMAWGSSSAKDTGRRARAAWKLEEWPLSNVWAGVSVEDQPNANVRVPDLLATKAAVRWLSAEPLLGPIDLGQLQEGLPSNAWLTWLDGLNWVVLGGESDKGPRARPMHPAWVSALRDQCVGAGVAFLFKQWGDWHAFTSRDVGKLDGKPMPETTVVFEHQAHAGQAVNMWRIGKERAGRDLDGRTYDGLPA
jgi:protein gp37